MKKLGPSQSSVLMTLVLQPDTPKNRAQILAVTKKLLASTDPGVSCYSIDTSTIILQGSSIWYEYGPILSS